MRIDLLFEQAASEAGARVERVPATPSGIGVAIERRLGGARSVVVADGEVLAPELIAAARATKALIPKPTDDQLTTADAGITEAFAGVASTGSVCIAMGRSRMAAASLLMPLHIVLLPIERLVSRPRDLFDPACMNGVALRRNLVIVTGPSATADMGPLVRGVHGPRELHILVLE
jgi:L-lactate dehydrogenase complex protein LldG